MSYLADKIVFPNEQSSRLLGILYPTVNIKKNNDAEIPLIVWEQN